MANRFPSYEKWTNDITDFNRMCRELPGLGMRAVPVRSRVWYAYYWLRFMLGVDYYKVCTGTVRTVDTIEYAPYKYISRRKIRLLPYSFGYRLGWISVWLRHRWVREKYGISSLWN